MTAHIRGAFTRHRYALAFLAIALSTALFLPGRETFAKGQWALLYLLVILLVASVAGAGPAVLAAVLAFFTWNLFFLPPYHTLQIHDAKDWLSLAAFLIVGVIVGVQAGRMRDREARALARERETAALNRLSAATVSQTTVARMAERCLREVVDLLGAASATLFVAREGEPCRRYQSPPDAEVSAAMAERACRVFREGGREGPREGGREGRHDGLPADDGAAAAGERVAGADAAGLCIPVRSSSGVCGVLAVETRADGRPYSAGDVRLVASLGNLVGAFLEREQLLAMAAQAAAEREADRLKTSLLSSVSHELKTPLAALTATVSNLLESDVDWDEQNVRDELRAIIADVTRLNDSIGALLDLSRLEADAWEPRREVYELSDILAAGIDSLPVRLRERVRLDLPEDSPLVDVDFAQMTRVVRNLLENALHYGGDDGVVAVGGRACEEGVRVWVEDQGPGIPADEHEAVFEKFFRGRAAAGRVVSGTGLGLAIAREIVHSHGGAVRVEDVDPHGARLVVTLPAGPDHNCAWGEDGT